MNHQELEHETQDLLDAGIWQVFGYLPDEYRDRVVIVLPDGCALALQGKIYWLSDFLDVDCEDELDLVYGYA